MFLNSYRDLEDFCMLLHSVQKIPVQFVEDNGLVLFEISEGTGNNPLTDYREGLFTDILKRGSGEFPRTYSSEYLENFLVVYAETSDGNRGYLVLGPCIAHVVSDSLDSIIDVRITAKDKGALNRYYKTLQVINYHDLVKLGIFVHYLLHKKILDYESINTAGNALQNFHTRIENEFNIQFRDINYLHRSSFFERHFYNLIKNGETEELKKLLNVHSLDGEYIVLAKNNPLRSWKNLVICFITISCRAAMEGGLATETIYAISDVYIQELEELVTIKDVEDLANKVFLDLAGRVRDLKRHHYSKLVTMCQNLISGNLDKTISLAELARQLNVNGSYLSAVFKKEVGIPVSEYILQEKISEAKRMLLFTRFSILDISTSLDFCDQSHFTKVFKKNTGLSPREFRNTHSSSTLWY